MTSHQTGSIIGTRQGSQSVVHTMRITPTEYGAIGNVDQKICTIKASPQNPVCLRANLSVLTPFVNGANAVTGQLGTTVGAFQVIAASDLKAVTGTNYAASTGPFRWFTADTDLYYRQVNTISAPSAGEAYLSLEMWEGNILRPSNQGD